MLDLEKLASLPLSVDLSKRTRLRLSVTENGHRCFLTGISGLPEEEAVADFMKAGNSRHLVVHEAVPIPFALAYIVDGEGQLVDDCQLEQAEDESLMVDDFMHRNTFRWGEYWLVRATEMRGVRTILSVTPLENQRTFGQVTA